MFVFSNLHVYVYMYCYCMQEYSNVELFSKIAKFLVGCQCYITACLIYIFPRSLLYHNYYGTLSCDFVAIVSVLYINFQNTGIIYLLHEINMQLPYLFCLLCMQLHVFYKLFLPCKIIFDLEINKF